MTDTSDKSPPRNITNPPSMEWTDKAYDSLVAGTTTARVLVTEGVAVAHFDGPCPYCGCALSQRILLTAVGTDVRTLGVGGEGDAMTLDVDFECDCGEAHSGRPEAQPHGCGTAWRLTLFVETS